MVDDGSVLYLKGARSLLKKLKKQPLTPEQRTRIKELLDICSGFLGSSPTPPERAFFAFFGEHE